MKKVMDIIIMMAAIALLIMSIVETNKNIAAIEETRWKPTEIYEFTNKNIEWSH